MPAPVKIPRAIPMDSTGLNDLKPGDIVFFTMRPKRRSKLATASDEFVKLFQSFVQGDNGHKNTDHNGFVIEEDYTDNGVTKTRLRIVHLTFETKHDNTAQDKLSHFKVWDPAAFMKGRNTLIYRIKDDADRQALAAELKTLLAEKRAALKEKLKFKWWVIVEAWLRRMVNPVRFYNKKVTQPQKIEGPSICPEFVARSFIEASRRLEEKGKGAYRSKYMNIAPCNLLKSMQSYLHSNTNYDCFAGLASNNGYKELVAEINKQADRLEAVTGLKSQKSLAKASAIRSALYDFEKTHPACDEYQKAVYLLKAVMPILKQNTGTGMGEAKSYQAVKALAKSQSIYPEFYAVNAVPETAASIDSYLDELKYTDKQKRVYHKYRRLGYSDRAARFEANPSVMSWAENNPRTFNVSSIMPLSMFGAMCFARAKVECTKSKNGLYETPAHSVRATAR